MIVRLSAGGAARSVRGGRIGAVLGPTNTGKTHFAIERMLAHRSGMIGLPLRLLAREVYERVVALKGAPLAALVTGEEKIVPPDARYFVCTVEAMPVDLSTAFLAVDEIQLCADEERGHVFTQRLLHARGDEETLLLGAETMRAAIRRFVPEADFLARPRFSDLSWTGHKKLTRLPRRTAIVAFSAEDVYGIADLVRRQRGGAAVVLGALSPRTRNAQVELYQSGEVDFLVATDAIGMGLNMDIDHVAFAALEKFDGFGTRALRADELGQIAGRAGRHMNDGTFGTTSDCEAPDEVTLSRIETHRYEPIRQLRWRNVSLDFRSIGALLGSLEAPPPERGLARARPTTDVAVLRLLAGSEAVANAAKSPAAVKTLWNICQLPDFRKLSIEEHARLVTRFLAHLTGPDEKLPQDWFASQVARLDDTEGDVAILSGRLAQIRTWTYAANKPGWIADAPHWQNETRAVEDRLSDALHEKLTQRFIDRRTSLVMRGLRDDETLDLALDESGAAVIGGEVVGKFEGLRFVPENSLEGVAGHALRTVMLKFLEEEYRRRASSLAEAADQSITLSEHGRLWWDGAIVAHLKRGPTPLDPDVLLVCDEELENEHRKRAQGRLRNWLESRIATRLEPLIALRAAVAAKSGAARSLPSHARGVAHQLCEGLGSLDRSAALLPDDVRGAARTLAPFGVRFGRYSVFLPRLLRPHAAELLALLSAVWTGTEQIPAPPRAGLTSFAAEQWHSPEFLAAAGFRRWGDLAVRLDIAEGLEQLLESAVRDGSAADTVLPHLLSLTGASAAALVPVLHQMGWYTVAVGTVDSPARVWRRTPATRARRRARAPNARRTQAAPGSPFAGLATLIAAD